MTSPWPELEPVRNAMYRPLALIADPREYDSNWVPSLARETSSVRPVLRSRTNVSSTPFVSPATRFDAWDVNATYLPSLLSDGPQDRPSAAAPSLATETHSVRTVRRS
jgi:hypothetical protein